MLYNSYYKIKKNDITVLIKAYEYVYEDKYLIEHVGNIIEKISDVIEKTKY